MNSQTRVRIKNPICFSYQYGEIEQPAGELSDGEKLYWVRFDVYPARPEFLLYGETELEFFEECITTRKSG